MISSLAHLRIRVTTPQNVIGSHGISLVISSPSMCSVIPRRIDAPYAAATIPMRIHESAQGSGRYSIRPLLACARGNQSLSHWSGQLKQVAIGIGESGAPSLADGIGLADDLCAEPFDPRRLFMDLRRFEIEVETPWILAGALNIQVRQRRKIRVAYLPARKPCSSSTISVGPPMSCA
jgi:hypothetical protein